MSYQLLPASAALLAGRPDVSHLWCFQAFSWWPELMAEHTETFLSLYRADMDAALQVQPVDSWNSFPLFQLLNNFLRSDGECDGVRLQESIDSLSL